MIFSPIFSTSPDDHDLVNVSNSGPAEHFSESDIGTLYLFLGLTLFAVSLLYLFMALQQLFKRRRRAKTDADYDARKASAAAAAAPVYGRTEKAVVWLAFVSILFFLGGEFAIFTFLPAFAVMSDLHLTKAQGVNILAIYFLTYAFSRISCFFLTFW